MKEPGTLWLQGRAGKIALQEAIDHADIDAMAFRRQQKRGLWGRFYPTRDVPLHQGVMCLYIKADVPLHQGAT